MDIIRVLAICLVVICHVNNNTWPMVTRSFIYSLGWMGVPVFVMLTGFLMVPRRYDGIYLNKFLKRNLFPLFCAFEIWNLLYYMFYTLRNGYIGVNQTLRFVRIAFFVGDTGSAFWFMPMIIGLYLGLPIFASLVQKNDLYTRLILFCITYFSLIVCTLQQVFKSFEVRQDIKSVLEMNIFGASVWGGSIWMVYLFIGYKIHETFLSEIRIPYLLIVFFLSLFGNIGLTYLQLKRGSAQQFYGSMFVLLPACALVLILRKLLSSLILPDRICVFFRYLSQLSFSVYLIHILIIPIVESHVYSLLPRMFRLRYCIVVLLVILISFFIGWILSYIPGFKRYALLIK
nr:acyltransferase [Bifidobacterium simiiventris]